MEKYSESKNSFDSVLMDLNENPSIDEYQVNNDVGEQSQCVSTKVQNATFSDDRALSNSTNTTQSSLNCFEFLPDESKDNSNTSFNNNDKNFDSGIHESKNNTFNKENLLDSTYGNMNLLNNCNVMVPDVITSENGVSTSDISDTSKNTEEMVTVSFGEIDSAVTAKVEIPKIVTSVSGTDTNLPNNVETMNFKLKNDEHSTDTNSIFDSPGEFQADFIKENFDEPTKDEEFQDAVQFFKDPSSYDFLENAGGNSNEPFNPRSSLYMKFDPLASKISTDLAKRSNDLKEIAEKETIAEDDETENNTGPIMNKHLDKVKSPRHSTDNILISFDSPVANNTSQSVPMENTAKPTKLYTEEEYQQALKIQELLVQETFLKNRHDLEMERTKKLQDMESKVEKQSIIISALNVTLTEAVEVVHILSDKQKYTDERSSEEQTEIVKLKEDLKISTEDLQKFESMFSDFHKRYETCKGMLNDYKQNEDHLKQQLENLTLQLQEKDEMYKALQSRTEEVVDKANTEVANAKKASEAQVAVLKAQLKKADLKISSLESDVKHVKIENEKLSGICDDLMAKVTES